jgi:hypothetical protein
MATFDLFAPKHMANFARLFPENNPLYIQFALGFPLLSQCENSLKKNNTSNGQYFIFLCDVAKWQEFSPKKYL